ncbi:MAG: N-acetyltransferase family protein [Geminicoccaceae bacterium]
MNLELAVGAPSGVPAAPAAAIVVLDAIVPARPQHLAAMTAIYREQVEDGVGTWENPLPGRAEIARRLAAARAAGLPALVALDRRRRVLGFSWARPFRERAAYRGTAESSIYIAGHARGHGIGRALLTAIVAGCAERGCRELMAVVGDARNHASLRLHQSLGFEPVGYLPGAGEKPDGPVDVVILQRHLAQAAATGLAA